MTIHLFNGKIVVIYPSTPSVPDQPRSQIPAPEHTNTHSVRPQIVT